MDLEIKFGKIIFDDKLSESYLSKIYNIASTNISNDSSGDSSNEADNFSIHNLCRISNKNKYFDTKKNGFNDKLFEYKKMKIKSDFFTNINEAYDIIILLTNFEDGETIHNYDKILLYVSGKIIKMLDNIRIKAKLLYKKKKNKITLRYLKYAEWLYFWAKLSHDTFRNTAFISVSLCD